MTEGQVRARETPTTYKPTTKVVRDEWCYGVQDVDMDGNVVVSFDEAGRQFDRWLAVHDAQLIEKLADEITINFGRGFTTAEELNAESAAEVWLRARAAEIREGTK